MTTSLAPTQSGLDVVDRALRRAHEAGAAQADAVLVAADSCETRVRGNEIDFVKQARERCLGLRALVAGPDGLRSAICSTSDIQPDAVDRIAEQTVALARSTAADPSAGLPAGGFEKAPPELGLSDPADAGVSVEARIEDARRAELAARAVDPRIDNSEGSQAGSELARVTYGNSLGFLASYEAAHHSLYCEPLASSSAGMQRDSWHTAARALADLEAPESVGRRAGERALRRLGARPVATCEAAVLFDAVTAPTLLAQLAACITGYAVYRRSSFLADRLGEKIASARVHVIDDGRVPGGLGSRPFDGEGLPTRRNTVIDRGVLSSWLLDTYSAGKLGMTSTGSAARRAAGAPTAGITNFWLEPGEGTLEELIASTERGLLVTELIGSGFNAVTGDYSRGASGLWIEGGEVAHPVEEVTIAGNLGDMLRNIDAVAGELVWLDRIASPPLRIAAMTIAGT